MRTQFTDSLLFHCVLHGQGHITMLHPKALATSIRALSKKTVIDRQALYNYSQVLLL